MKLETSDINIQSSGIIDEADFGIDIVDQAPILDILRNKLYSDKIRAVIREYYTNAVDAHGYAGCLDKPFETGLPTPLNPVFWVRDFGPGLSHSDVQKLFIKYGKSTKRDSNDAIGQLGLGAKAGFSYSDSFTVTSWFQGKKTIYTAYIDETKIGKLVTLSSTISNEPSGLEIRIAVQEHDTYQFLSKAAEVLRYFDVKPIIKGGQPAPTQEHSRLLVAQDKTWFVRASGQAVAVMGQIGYPLDTGLVLSTITDSQLQKSAEALLRSSIVIKFPIGALSISASRESLEYTARTKLSIQQRLSQILKELEDTLGKSIKDCKTLWDARIAYYKATSLLDYALRPLIPTTWNGQPVNSYFRFQTGYSTQVKFLYPNMVGPTDAAHHMDGERFSQCILLVNDVEDFWLARSRSWLQSNLGPNGERKTAIILNVSGDDAAKKKAVATFTQSHLMDGVPTCYLSNVPYVKRAGIRQKTGRPTDTGEIAVVRKPKNVKTIFTFDQARISGYAWKYWTETDVDLQNTVGVYCEVRHHHPTNLGSNTELIMRLKALKELGVTIPVIYGVKTALLEKLGPGWMTVQEWSQQEADKYFKRFKSRILYAHEHAYQLDVYLNLLGAGSYRQTQLLETLEKLPKKHFRKDNPLRKLKDLVEHSESGRKYYNTYCRIASSLSVTPSILPAHEPSYKGREKLWQQYPLLQYTSLYGEAKDLMALAEYFDLINDKENNNVKFTESAPNATN